MKHCTTDVKNQSINTSTFRVQYRDDGDQTRLCLVKNVYLE